MSYKLKKFKEISSVDVMDFCKIITTYLDTLNINTKKIVFKNIDSDTTLSAYLPKNVQSINVLSISQSNKQYPFSKGFRLAYLTNLKAFRFSSKESYSEDELKEALSYLNSYYN